MKCEPFQFVPHTADVAVLIRGHDFAELLRNAARALYSLAGVSAGTEADNRLKVVIDSVDSDTLLVDWLNELIYRLYAEALVFSSFSFCRLDAGNLEAVCRGCRLRSHAQGPVREIKAATYHLAHIENENGVCAARVVFDV